MTKIKWKGYPVKKGTRVTTAVQSSKSTLRAINDIYILEEEAPKPEVDKPSGFADMRIDLIGGLYTRMAHETTTKAFQEKMLAMQERAVKAVEKAHDGGEEWKKES